MSDSPNDKPDAPSPSLWPIGFAIGIALVLIGLVVSWPAAILGAVLAIVFGVLWIRDSARSHGPVDSAAAHELMGETPSPARAAAEAEHLETYGRAGFLTLATLGLGGAPEVEQRALEVGHEVAEVGPHEGYLLESLMAAVASIDGPSTRREPWAASSASASAWSIMVVTMRSKLRNSPICTVTRTMEKTIPMTVAMNRSRS